MDWPALDRLLTEQDGVLSRRQLVELGGDDELLDRMLRRHELRRIRRGVFVNHTGELSWNQRAWSVLMHYWPSALVDESAIRAEGLRLGRRAPIGWEAERGGVGGPLHVAVDAHRRVKQIPGVRLWRLRALDALLHPARKPPRMRLEPAILRVASRAGTDSTAVAVLADACQSRRTTAVRLLGALNSHPNLPRRAEIRMVLEDVATGTHSLLEHRYVTRVERPHGLPESTRQRRVELGGTSTYRDAEYRDERTIVELDGRLGHEDALDFWADLDRDLNSAVEGDLTVRLGWRHVDEACRCAASIGRVLNARGWRGTIRPCGPGCTAADRPA